MRKFVLAALLLSVTADASATGQRRGHRWRRTPTSGGGGSAFTIEDPAACTLIPGYGQSSSVGVCSGSCSVFGDPPCDTGPFGVEVDGALCEPLTTTPVTGIFSPTWDASARGGLGSYVAGIIPLDADGTGSRGNAETVAMGVVQQYRAMAGNPVEAIFTCWPGQQGTSIEGLSRGPRDAILASSISSNVCTVTTADTTGWVVGRPIRTTGLTINADVAATVTAVTASSISFACTGADTADNGTGLVSVPQSDSQTGYDIYYARLMDCITVVRDAVAAAPATYGCNGNVVFRGFSMTQGETDFATPSGYQDRIGYFLADLNEDATSLLAQTSQPQGSWDQPQNFLANSDTRSPVGQVQLDAAVAFPQLHLGPPRGQYNPGTTTTPFLGETSSGVHAAETSGASPLHYSALTQQHIGAEHGKILYNAIHLNQPWTGMRIQSATQTGNTITACWNPVGALVLDSSGCPPHWNGAFGLELYTDEVGAPTITNVATNGSNCLDLTLSQPATDLGSTRLEVGFRGLRRDTGTEPENGCRDSDVLTNANPGAPFSNIRDSDSTANYGDSGALWNWAAVQSFAGVSGLNTLPEDTVAHFGFDSADEAVVFADGTFCTGECTASAWVRMSASDCTGGDRTLWSKWTGTRWQMQFSGGAARVQWQFDGSTSNRAYTSAYGIPCDDAWHNVVGFFNGAATSGQRVRWVVDGIEDTADVETGIPSTIPSVATGLSIGGNGTSGGFADDVRDVAIWPSIVSDAELVDVFRSSNNLSTISPTPAYFVRPGCEDDLTVANGVQNYGTASDDGDGTNLEADDRVIDNASACATLDGGVADSGTPDSGAPDSGSSDAGTADAGFASTVSEAYALECDGVDDRVTYGVVDLLDGTDDMAFCMITTDPDALSNLDFIVGQWESGDEQWYLRTRANEMRTYVYGTSAGNYLGNDGAGNNTTFVSGPPQTLCFRFELSNTGFDKIRGWRNGVALPTLITGSTPATTFRTISNDGFSFCAEHGGGQEWAGYIHEFAMWADGNVPTDAELANSLSVNASDWSCQIPNYGFGQTWPEADLLCRFENSLDCELSNRDGDPATTTLPGTGVGGVGFRTSDLACPNTRQNYTSVLPATSDIWSSSTWTEASSNSMAFCVTTELSAAHSQNMIVGQLANGASPTEQSWAFVQRNGSHRVYVASSATQAIGSVPYAQFTTSATGRHNYCVKIDLGQAAQSDRVRLWEDGVEVTAPTIVGTIPSTFVFNSGALTYFAGSADNALGWGGAGKYLDDFVVWRDQDGEPTAAQMLNSVAFDPATEVHPDYSAISGVPVPGCWFTLDGILTDHLNNCSSWAQTGGVTTWPAPAEPLSGTPDAGVADSGPTLR